MRKDNNRQRRAGGRRQNKATDFRLPDEEYTLANIPDGVPDGVFVHACSENRGLDAEGITPDDLIVFAAVEVRPFDLAAIRILPDRVHYIGRFQPRGDAGELVWHPLEDDEPHVFKLTPADVRRLTRAMHVERNLVIVRVFKTPEEWEGFELVRERRVR